MPIQSSAVHLGEAELGGHRHVCGIFEGPGEAASVLVPFVVDGLKQGDRVVHIVEDRDAYLRRLGRSTNVSAAVASGQLTVRNWDEAYLSAGAFSAARMRASVRRWLREAPALGFGATRLIGDMNWAQEGVPGVNELGAYERAIDAIVARPRTWVVCAYDASRHHAAQIADILEAHRAALIGGRLRRTPTAAAPAARERILAAAALLFAEDGIAQTGVDTLIEAAGVAKATFYRHFPSKDALVLAWLRDPRTRWFDRVRALAEERARRPSEVIPRLFEATAEWLEDEDYVGCPYLNTSVELSSNSRHPASQAARDYLGEISDYLEARAAAAGGAKAARLAPELHALLAGAISLAVANRTSSYALAARDAAVRLLDAERLGGRRTSRVTLDAPPYNYRYRRNESMAELTERGRETLPSSQFAYVDKDGGEHLPIHDESHARNAMARWNQTAFESEAAKERARKKILAATNRFRIDVDPDSNIAKPTRSLRAASTRLGPRGGRRKA